MAGIATLTIMQALESHLAASALFDTVNKHEPSNAPVSGGLTGAIWWDNVRPAPEHSGLPLSSAVTTFMIRVYSKAFQKPQDMIDPTIVAAVDALFIRLHGDYTLGGTIREIDLLGLAGPPMTANAGYVTIDGTVFRTVDITVPCLINDAWIQTA